MFGFVTFVYPETVKLILSKGNPHFVCDARVLVKPYKEKGKVPDKYRHLLFLLLYYLFLCCFSLQYALNVLMFIVICRKQQQQVDRGDFSPCGTPTGLDARDQFDLQLGRLMF